MSCITNAKQKNKQTITQDLDGMAISSFSYLKYHRQPIIVFPCLGEPWHSTSSSLLQNIVNVFLQFLLMHSPVYLWHQYNQEVRIRIDSHMSHQTNGKTAAHYFNIVSWWMTVESQVHISSYMFIDGKEFLKYPPAKMDCLLDKSWVYA